MTEVITVLKSEIPVSPGSQLYEGFVALKKCHGKSYLAFRDMCGGTKGSSGRKFSPSTVRRKAQELGFAVFGTSIPLDMPPVSERQEDRREAEETAVKTHREGSVRVLDEDFEAELFQMTSPLHGQYPRPWMTDLDDPRDADVFLVGQNQARGYAVSLVGSHQRHVDALLNRNGETCRGLYDELNPEPSPTRRNIDRMAAYLRREGLRTLETNVVCFSSPISADLTAVERTRGAEIFKWLSRRITPRVVIVHGSGAAKDFARIYRGRAQVIEMPSLAPPAYNRWHAQSDTVMQRVARQAAAACGK